MEMEIMKARTTTFVKRCRFVVGFILALLLLKLKVVVGGSSVYYTVGDEEEWSSQTNFGLWATKYNFTVGDVLLFKYVKGEHNAYEVTEKTFRSCDTSSGVLGKYESGEDEVVLTQPKTYFFICNVAGHCLGGMRFRIQVTLSNNSTSSQNNNIPPPNLAPLIQPHSSASQISTLLLLLFMPYLLPFGLLLLLLLNDLYYCLE